VEREEEYATVKQIGVHLTQGFLFHEPRYAGKRRIEKPGYATEEKVGHAAE
jgi:c-di-GMP-related signal transduction protein